MCDVVRWHIWRLSRSRSSAFALVWFHIHITISRHVTPTSAPWANRPWVGCVLSLVYFSFYCDLCKKTVQFIIRCKGDIVVVDIKQHKSQLKNSNFTITQSAKFFWHCAMVMFEFLNCDLCSFMSTTTMSPLHRIINWAVFYINICSFIAIRSNLKLNKIWQ